MAGCQESERRVASSMPTRSPAFDPQPPRRGCSLILSRGWSPWLVTLVGSQAAPCGHGRVQAVAQLHCPPCASGGDPFRQVPCAAPPRRGARQGTQAGLRPAKRLEPPRADRRQHVIPDRPLHRALAIRGAEFRQVLRQPPLAAPLPPSAFLRLAAHRSASRWSPKSRDSRRPATNRCTPAPAGVRDRCHRRADCERPHLTGNGIFLAARGGTRERSIH